MTTHSISINTKPLHGLYRRRSVGSNIAAGLVFRLFISGLIIKLAPVLLAFVVVPFYSTALNKIYGPAFQPLYTQITGHYKQKLTIYLPLPIRHAQNSCLIASMSLRVSRFVWLW